MKGFTLVGIIVLFGCSVFAEYGSFTSYVNLEKLYTLEDELIALTDVIVKQEMTLHGDKDAHNLCNITRYVHQQQYLICTLNLLFNRPLIFHNYGHNSGTAK